MRNQRAAALTLSVVAFAGLTAACGGGSGGGSPSLGSSSSPAQPDASSNPAGAKAAVTALYTHFFQAPPSQAASLLQDGSSLGKAISVAAKIKGKNKESAKVSSVTFQGADLATVTYALSSNGTVVLPSATGQAVYENGRWLFSKTTFCTLVSLGNGNKPVPGC